MKVHLIRIAVLVLAIVSPLLATPVAARPKDPDSFLVTPTPQGDCNFRTSFGDPPLNRRCPSGSSQLAVAQTVSQRPAEAQQPLRTAVSTATRAGAPQYPQEMRTTNVSAGSAAANATSVHDYAVPDALRGACVGAVGCRSTADTSTNQRYGKIRFFSPTVLLTPAQQAKVAAVAAPTKTR